MGKLWNCYPVHLGWTRNERQSGFFSNLLSPSAEGFQQMCMGKKIMKFMPPGPYCSPLQRESGQLVRRSRACVCNTGLDKPLYRFESYRGQTNISSNSGDIEAGQSSAMITRDRGNSLETSADGSRKRVSFHKASQVKVSMTHEIT